MSSSENASVGRPHGMVVAGPTQQKKNICGRAGTCFLEAGSRAILSALLRVYGHGLFSEADVKKGLEKFRYWLAEQAMAVQKQEGSGGHPEEVIKYLMTQYPFLTRLWTYEAPNWNWAKINEVLHIIYERGSLPAAASISIFYDDENKQEFKQLLRISKDLPNKYKPRRDRKCVGHAMTLVGTAAGGKYFVLLNSWGAQAHGEQKGFWLLEAAADLLNDLKVKVYAVGFSKNDEAYKSYGQKWNEASKEEKVAWLKLRKKKFQEVTQVVPEFDEFNFDPSLDDASERCFIS